jgi:phosphate transport system ATP-binding protein
LKIAYGNTSVIKGIDLAFRPGKVTALIGPSGCGKTTLLRSLNRLNELIKGCKVDGEILLDGENILQMDPMLLRRKVGMVFQKPNPFPMSIRDNILYGLEADTQGKHKKQKINKDEVIQNSLVKAAIWDEIKNRLGDNAFRLSTGQQQRICIARCLANSPEVILMDEPAASLDPTSAAKVEQSIIAMKDEYTVVIVTHNMQQARRISDYTAFMFLGEIVEFGETEQIFENPQNTDTRDYINGRFG